MRASRYVSYLAAEIEPQAISTLNRFESEATKVMERIAAAGSKGSAGFANSALGVGATRSLESTKRAATATATELGKVSVKSREAAGAANLLAGGFTHAAAALGAVQGPLGPIAGRLSAIGSILRTMTGFSLAGVLAGSGAFALGTIATGYQQVHDRLAPLYESQKQLNGALDNVVGIAQRTRQALQPVAELYAKITLAGRAAGISDQRSSRIAELASKAAAISGGTAQTKEAGLGQFAQGFGSGTLAGDELKSIKENTLGLAKAIADGLGVPISKLKELGAAGQLTPKVIAEALERSAGQVELAFSKLPKRVGTSLTELQNNLAVAVGKIDENLGATSGIAQGISLIANNLDTVILGVGTLAAAFAASSFATAAQAVVNYGNSLVVATARSLELSKAVNQGNAVALGSAEANRQRAAFAAQSASTEVSAARSAVAGAKEYQAQVKNNISAIEKQIATQIRAKETARLLDAASRSTGGAGKNELVKATTNDLNASQRALIVTQQQLIAVDLELAAAQQRLIAVTGAYTVATAESAIADNVAAASTGRLAGVKAVLTTAMSATSAAASGLVSFLGGPWGVAFTAAAGAAIYLASRTDQAAAAISGFEGGEAALATRLGITTGQIQNQTAAVRALAVALLQTNLVKARTQALGVTGQLSGDIATAASKIYVAPYGGQKSQAAARDRAALFALAKKAEQGNFNPLTDFKALSDITGRNPSSTSKTLADRLFGTDPTRLAEDTKGLAAALFQIADANKEIAKYGDAAQAKLAPILGGGGGKPETAAQRRARLNRQGAIDGADTGLKRARAELAQAKAEGPKSGESDEQYIARIAQMTSAVSGLAAAQHKAAGGAKSAEAARKREAAAIETASDKADRLSGIINSFTDDSPIERLNKLSDAAEKAKRQVQDLVGERVQGFGGAFTQKDANRIKDQIDATTADRINAPYEDSIKLEKQRLDNLQLELTGQGDLATLHQRRLDIEKQQGTLSEDQIRGLADQLVLANKLTKAEQDRSDVIENNAQFLGRVRDAGTAAIRSTLAGDLKGGIKGLAESLRDAFLDAKAQEIAKKLFGDPEKKYRDEMTKGLNRSADDLTKSSIDLKAAAAAIETAAHSLGASTTVNTGGGSSLSTGQVLNNVGGFLDNLDNTFSGLLRAVTNPTPGSSSFDETPIVVTGQRTRAPGGIDSVVSNLFSGLFSGGGQKLFGKGGRLNGGDLLSIGSGLLQSFFPDKGGNYKGKGFNDKIQPIADLAIQALNMAVPGAGAIIGATNALSNAVGLKPFAGGLFGLGGSLIAKLFGFGKKIIPKGGATISDLSGNYRQTGSGDAKANAIGAADSVTSGLQKILDALGGTLGTFAVTIGQFDGDYRVNTTGGSNLGRATPGVTDFNKDAEGAIKFAILDAIQDGAIKGIREGSIRLLKAGKDLDYALQKALKFEDVFRRLKKIKDPVGAAIDDLNREFGGLIKIFQEAGASTEEFAQLKELYGLERVDAIKNASQAAVNALDDFIKGLTAGPDSPLSKRTVYDNARANVDVFRADIASGKVVNQEDLIAALNNYQSASSNLYGSRDSFFADFEDILGLARTARANVGTTPTGGTLPASPFDGLDANGNAIVAAVATTNDILTQILVAVTNPATVTGTGTGSTIANLPSNGTTGPNGRFGGTRGGTYEP